MQDRTSANSMKVLLQRAAGPYMGVKTSKAQNEQMLSGLPSIADMRDGVAHFRLVP